MSEEAPEGAFGRSHVTAPRVLVVEDNADLLHVTTCLLLAYGCEVKGASTGPAGLHLAGPFQPDAAVLDLNLPGMRGVDVARQLRAQRPRGELLVVALSVFAADEVTGALSAGIFDHHFVKPVDVG